MPHPNPAAMDFLLTRRSRPAKTLVGPGPEPDALRRILTAAARTPDHGKLEPWRFLLIEGAGLTRIAKAVAVRGAALGKAEDDITKARNAFANSPFCVAVVEVQKDSAKIPAIEQTYSAGAVCLALLNAALAEGYGANWLSGWASHDRAFVTDTLGLAPHERIAGFVHIGTETSPPPERPRPDIDQITERVDA